MTPDPHHLDLAGQWTLSRDATGDTFPGSVPGGVHHDLARAGHIPDYFWRDDEATLRWIDRETWTYTRRFSIDRDPPDSAELRFDGLDTFAEVRLNGETILQADNMFRTWRVEVAGLLRRGENELSVTFRPPLEAMADGERDQSLAQWNTFSPEFAGRGHVRKMACAFGWDWGPVMPTMGLWRGVSLRLGSATLEDVRVVQDFEPGRVRLRIGYAGEATATLRLRGELVAQSTDTGGCELKVDDPELWWPAGLGAQPLYDLEVAPQEGPPVVKRIGLRTIELRQEADEWGRSFEFVINGRPVFAKGANWVPSRVLPTTYTAREQADRLDDAVAGNFNMLRVWGGGIYESDAFYDACDERGLLVWQDFAFACGAYRSDDAFLDSVRAEAVDNVRRLRHHACLAVWCGNNEIEQGFAGRGGYAWEQYGRVFDETLPAVVREEDGVTPYIPSSGHTPGDFADRADHANQDAGDAHMWTVWFGGKPFEAQRDWTCRFMSEYGFQSYPELATVEAFTDPADRNVASRILDYHQRSQMGNRTIAAYLLDWFQMPPSFDGFLVASQISQALCVRYAAEHLRRIQPRNTGVLYWQLNDVWPCASWSSVDCFGRWKALQYEARRFFAPAHLSAEEDAASATVRLHVSNQGVGPISLPLRWEVTDTDGTRLMQGEATVDLAENAGTFAAEIDCGPLLDRHHAGDLLVWGWLGEPDAVVSRTWVSVARPKHLSLPEPGLTIHPGRDDRGGYWDISCDRPAIWVRLAGDGDAVFTDNFFHLHPGEPRRIRLLRGDPGDVRATSLFDLMQGREGPLAPKPADYSSPIKAA
jgi:beta-mannosidase